jgi:hypothetical protein
MANYYCNNPHHPQTPTIPERRMKSAIVDALYELEECVVRPLAGLIEVEHALIHALRRPLATGVRAEIATRRTARVLGSIARIMLKIEEAAK